MPNEHIVERRTPSVVSLRSKNFLTPILATLNGVVGRPTEKTLYRNEREIQWEQSFEWKKISFERVAVIRGGEKIILLIL